MVSFSNLKIIYLQTDDYLLTCAANGLLYFEYCSLHFIPKCHLILLFLALLILLFVKPNIREIINISECALPYN